MSIITNETDQRIKSSNFTSSVVGYPIFYNASQSANLVSELIPVVTSSFSARTIYIALRNIESAQKKLQLLQERGEITILRNWDIKKIRKQHRQEIKAQKEYLRRCYLKIASCSLRVLQVSTILIQKPLLKNGIDGAVDIVAHGLLLDRELTTHTSEQLLNPQSTTRKDKFHHIFLTASSTLGLIGGIYTVANSLNFIDENDLDYQVALAASKAASLSTLAYMILQYLNVFSPRD